MKKPNSLRLAIQAAVPELKRSPERLQIFIDKGKIVTTAGPSRSFEYRYRLVLSLLDFAGDEDVIFVAILGWLQANNEWEILQAYVGGQREGITFDVDVLDNDKVDLEIALDLSERIIVSIGPGGVVAIEHAEEPPLIDFIPEAWTGAPLVEVSTADGETLVP